MIKLSCETNLNNCAAYLVCIFISEKMQALFSHTLAAVENLFRSNRSSAFFVRGFGCALFNLRRKQR